MKPSESTPLASASIAGRNRRQPPPPPSRVIQLSGADLEPIEDDAATSRDLGRYIELSDSDLQVLDQTGPMSPPPRPVRPLTKATTETHCSEMDPKTRANWWSSREPHGPVTFIVMAVTACALTFVRPTSNSPNVHAASIANTESRATATRAQTASDPVVRSGRSLVLAAQAKSARPPAKWGPASAHHRKSKSSATVSATSKSAHGKASRKAALPTNERSQSASK
jgi:hypothetical protein